MSGTFKEFFDVSLIDERQLGEMEFVLNSPAYEHTFKKYMEGVLRQLNALAKDRSQKRKDEYPDDTLFGGIMFGEGLLEFFSRIIQETRMERIHASMQNVSNDDLYDAARRQGRVKPVVGLDQSAEPEPYNPAEDY